MENISVSVRLRAISKPDEKETSAWRVDGRCIIPFDGDVRRDSDGRRDTSDARRSSNYTADHVFGPECSTDRVYQEAVATLVHDAVEGKNVTIMTYGQTGSGKTYTMGTPDSPGVIQQALMEMFALIAEKQERDFLLRFSYLEIYNENVTDLLSPDKAPKNLLIKEDKVVGPVVLGLSEEIVTSPTDVLRLIKQGEAKRRVASSKMNERSNRSHSVARMVLESRSAGCENAARTPVVVSSLVLVDLAGSESVAKTGAEGERLKESSCINKSLLALGEVVYKLSEGAQASGAHIPYRDSKLTRILKPSLGGNAKTMIICTINPALRHLEESHRTLRFALRAKRVVNTVVVTEVVSEAAVLRWKAKELKEQQQKKTGTESAASAEARAEIAALRIELLRSQEERERAEKEAQAARQLVQQTLDRVSETPTRALTRNRSRSPGVSPVSLTADADWATQDADSIAHIATVVGGSGKASSTGDRDAKEALQPQVSSPRLQRTLSVPRGEPPSAEDEAAKAAADAAALHETHRREHTLEDLRARSLRFQSERSQMVLDESSWTSSLQAESSHLLTDIAQLQIDNASLQTENASLRADSARLQEESSRVQTQLVQEELDRLREERVRLQEEQAQLNSRLQADITRLEEQNTGLQDEVARLAAQLAAATAARLQHDEDMDETASMKAEVLALQAQNASLLDQVTALSTQLQHETAIQQEEKARLQADLAQAASQHQAEVARLRQDRASLQGQVARLEAQLEGDMAALQGEIARQVAQHQGEMARLEAEQTGLQDEVTRLNAQLQDEMAALRGQNARLQEEMADKAARHEEEVARVVMEHQEERAALEEVKAGLEQQLAAVRDSKARLKTQSSLRFSQQLTEVSRLLEDKVALQEELSRLRDEKAGLVQELSEARLRLDDQQQQKQQKLDLDGSQTKGCSLALAAVAELGGDRATAPSPPPLRTEPSPLREARTSLQAEVARLLDQNDSVHSGEESSLPLADDSSSSMVLPPTVMKTEEDGPTLTTPDAKQQEEEAATEEKEESREEASGTPPAADGKQSQKDIREAEEEEAVRLQGEVTRLEAEVAKVQEDVARLQELNARLQADNAQLRMEVPPGSLRQELQWMTATLATHEALAAELEAERDTALQLVEGLQTEAAQLQHTVAELHRQHTARIAESAEALAVANNRAGELEALVRHLQKEVEAATETVESVKSRYRTAQGEAQEAAVRHEAAALELREQLSAVLDELDDTRQKLRAREAARSTELGGTRAYGDGGLPGLHLYPLNSSQHAMQHDPQLQQPYLRQNEEADAPLADGLPPPRLSHRDLESPGADLLFSDVSDEALEELCLQYAAVDPLLMEALPPPPPPLPPLASLPASVHVSSAHPCASQVSQQQQQSISWKGYGIGPAPTRSGITDGDAGALSGGGAVHSRRGGINGGGGGSGGQSWSASSVDDVRASTACNLGATLPARSLPSRGHLPPTSTAMGAAAVGDVSEVTVTVSGSSGSQTHSSTGRTMASDYHGDYHDGSLGDMGGHPQRLAQGGLVGDEVYSAAAAELAAQLVDLQVLSVRQGVVIADLQAQLGAALAEAEALRLQARESQREQADPRTPELTAALEAALEAAELALLKAEGRAAALSDERDALVVKLGVANAAAEEAREALARRLVEEGRVAARVPGSEAPSPNADPEVQSSRSTTQPASAPGTPTGQPSACGAGEAEALRLWDEAQALRAELTSALDAKEAAEEEADKLRVALEECQGQLRRASSEVAALKRQGQHQATELKATRRTAEEREAKLAALRATLLVCELPTRETFGATPIRPTPQRAGGGGGARGPAPLTPPSKATAASPAPAVLQSGATGLTTAAGGRGTPGTAKAAAAAGGSSGGKSRRVVVRAAPWIEPMGTRRSVNSRRLSPRETGATAVAAAGLTPAVQRRRYASDSNDEGTDSDPSPDVSRRDAFKRRGAHAAAKSRRTTSSGSTLVSELFDRLDRLERITKKPPRTSRMGIAFGSGAGGAAVSRVYRKQLLDVKAHLTSTGCGLELVAPNVDKLDASASLPRDGQTHGSIPVVVNGVRGPSAGSGDDAGGGGGGSVVVGSAGVKSGSGGGGGGPPGISAQLSITLRGVR